MTKDQKIIKNKVGLLRLAQELDNVSKACEVMGYSRECRIVKHFGQSAAGIE